MACQVPVIATANGGICEVIEHGVTGFLCEVGDIDAMAGYAVTILSNPSRAAEIGHRARQRVTDVFSMEKVIPQYEELYHRLLGSDAEKPS